MVSLDATGPGASQSGERTVSSDSEVCERKSKSAILGLWGGASQDDAKCANALEQRSRVTRPIQQLRGMSLFDRSEERCAVEGTLRARCWRCCLLLLQSILSINLDDGDGGVLAGAWGRGRDRGRGTEAGCFCCCDLVWCLHSTGQGKAGGTRGEQLTGPRCSGSGASLALALALAARSRNRLGPETPSEQRPPIGEPAEHPCVWSLQKRGRKVDLYMKKESPSQRFCYVPL